MKKYNFLFSLFYLGGLALIAGLFLIFIPVDNRTNIAWMNIGIFSLIYTGFTWKYVIIFKPLEKFADDIPYMALYWRAFGVCSFISLICMFIFSKMEMPFEKQIILQGVILFVFFSALVLGGWSSARMRTSSDHEKNTMEQIRLIQEKAKQLKALIACLPGEYEIIRNIFSNIFENTKCIAGSTHPDARLSEEKILKLMAELAYMIEHQESIDVLCKHLTIVEKEITSRKLL